MNGKLNLENHIFVTSSNDTREICKPLFSSSAISYFDYFREYKDGSRIWLCTNENWTKYLYQKEFAGVPEFQIDFTQKIKGKYFLWDGLYELLPTVKARNLLGERHADARNYFNIDNGITYIDNHENYRDYYCFGTTPENKEIINFYLNNLDIFEKFSCFFQEKASDLINESIKNKIYLPQPRLNIKENKVLTRKNNNNLILDISLKTPLSARQSECLSYLSRGKTAKEIARILNISYRTVEHYIDDIKTKLNAKTKSELIKKFLTIE